MPSTSPAHAGLRVGEKLAIWHLALAGHGEWRQEWVAPPILVKRPICTEGWLRYRAYPLAGFGRICCVLDFSMIKDLLSLLTRRPVAAVASRRPLSRSLLEGCWTPLWKLFDSRLQQLLAESLVPVSRLQDADLAKQAKLVLWGDRQFCIEYEKALRKQFQQIIDDFVNDRLRNAGTVTLDDGSTADSRRNRLALVEFGDMELNTLIEAASMKVLNAADLVEPSLRMRLANAIQEVEIRPTESPFRPSIFFHALHQALNRIDGMNPSLVMQMMPFFDAHLSPLIFDAYSAVDKYLADLGYPNELSPHLALRKTSALRSSSSVGGAGGLGDGVGASRAADILDALTARVQMVQSSPMMPAGQAGMPITAGSGGLEAMAGGQVTGGQVVDGAPGEGFSPVAPLTFGTVPAIPVTGAAMHSFAETRPLVGGYALPGTVVALPGAPLPISAELFNAINEFQKQTAQSLDAVQRGEQVPAAREETAELRTQLMEKATEQVDKLTIELVGLLCERIDADRYLPQRIKDLLLQLQFPLIKVAVTDPALFLSPEQPARRLMDRIASSAIGWTPEGDINQRFIEEVEKAVKTVLSAPEEGITAFDRALRAFEAYLEDERTRDDDPVVRAKRALAEAENREVMAINAMITIRSAFDGVQIESYLRDFLLQTWPRVLVAISLREGAEHASVNKYLRIVPDLVWSVQPKLTQEDRQFLVKTIPSIVGELRKGLMLIDWPKDQMQAFFAQLMNSHAQAVKALELAHSNPEAQFQPSTMRIKLDGIRLDDTTPPPSDLLLVIPENQVKHALKEVDADVDFLERPNIDPSSKRLFPGLTDQQLDYQIATWRRGDWFDLKFGELTERMQLRWNSPRRTLFLFMSAENKGGHSLSTESIRAYLRSGDLAPVETNPLFDRVVHDVVSDLQHSSAVAAPVLN